MMYTVLIAVLFVLSILYPLLEDLYLFYVRGMPQGPLSLPIVLNMHLINPSKQHYSVTRLAERYGGVFSLRLGLVYGRRVVFVQDYKTTKQVLNCSGSADRPKLPFFDYIRDQGIGSRPYDDTWKLHTRIIHTALTKICSTSIDDNLDTPLKLLFQKLDMEVGRGFMPNQVLRQTNLCILASTVYGQHVHSIDDQHIQALAWIHDQYAKGLTMFHPMNFLPILKHFRIFKNIDKATQMRMDIVTQKYQVHKENYREQITDIMDVLVEAIIGNYQSIRLTDRQRASLDLPCLMMSVFTLFMAGEVNVTDMELWIMQYLASYKDVQEKMFQEISETVYNGAVVGSEHKELLPFTVAFLHEIQRIVTPNHFGVPRMTSEDIYVDDLFIPKETTVFCNLWGIHHDPNLWTNPNEFDPTRFLNKDGSILDKYELAKLPYLPYGWGKRVCIGRMLAMEIFFVFTARLVHNYKVSFPPGVSPDLNGRTALTLRPYPCKFILERRSKAE